MVLSAMDSEPDFTTVPLDKARALPLNADGRTKLLILEHKIPVNLRGSFELMVSADSKQLIGLRIQADPVVKALGNLYNVLQAGADASLVLHGNRNVRDFTGEAFDSILASGSDMAAQCPFLTARAAKARYAVHQANPSQHDATNAKNYAVSAPLDDVMTMGKLSQRDRMMLEKIYYAIPASVHGYFACDLCHTESGGLMVQNLVLDPQAAMKIIGAGLDRALGHPSRTHVIDRAGLEKLATDLPSGSRTIAS